MVDIEELGRLMIEHGLVIRAIPYETTSVYEIRHKDKYPDAVVFYSEARKCDMIRVTKKLSQGGKFIITQVLDQGTIINYWGKPGNWGKKVPVVFYDTIEQAVNSMIDQPKEGEGS